MDKYELAGPQWVKVTAELQPLIDVRLGNSALHALCPEPQDGEGNVPTSCFCGHTGRRASHAPARGDDSVAERQEI